MINLPHQFESHPSASAAYEIELPEFLLRSAKLAEQHADELAPARQALAAMLAFVSIDDALKVGSRNELEYLAGHAA